MQKEQIKEAIYQSLVNMLEFDMEKQWYESIEVDPLEETRIYSFTRDQLTELILELLVGNDDGANKIRVQ